MRRGLISGGVAILVAIGGCARTTEAPVAQPLQGAVVILLDTLRADHLSTYGYPRPTSPSIDKLADEGVRFDQAVSNASWTLPSVAALLAGEYPERVFRGRMTRSLIERFADAGVATAAITEGGYFSRAFGMDLGFGDYREEQGPVRLVAGGESGELATGGGIESTFAQAREWLAAHRDEPFLLVIHTYEVHVPYTRQEFATGMDPGTIGPVFGTDRVIPRLQSGELTLSAAEIDYVTALYDGGVAEADRHVGAWVDYLGELGLRDRTLLIVTSDHGEELNDQFPTRTGDHGHSLHDALLSIPLILVDPTREWPVRQVASQVRLLDVLPTVAELLDVPIDSALDGRSLLPLMRGEESADRTALASQTKAGPKRIALRHMGFKYIATVGPTRPGHPLIPQPESRRLYDLNEDPGETNNIIAERPELAQMLEAELHRQHRELSGSVEPDPEQELDPQLLERLRSLGYVR